MNDEQASHSPAQETGGIRFVFPSTLSAILSRD